MPTNATVSGSGTTGDIGLISGLRSYRGWPLCLRYRVFTTGTISTEGCWVS